MVLPSDTVNLSRGRVNFCNSFAATVLYYKEVHSETEKQRQADGENLRIRNKKKTNSLIVMRFLIASGELCSHTFICSFTVAKFSLNLINCINIWSLTSIKYLTLLKCLIVKQTEIFHCRDTNRLVCDSAEPVRIPGRQLRHGGDDGHYPAGRGCVRGQPRLFRSEAVYGPAGGLRVL